MACIAGGIAQAFYKKIPEKIVTGAMQKLTTDLKEVVVEFNNKFRCEP